ncbi:MAG: PEP-CTERM sorting domain-containing protein [Planctomycetes bacterium]|nr:PEP-CTERM sorting domain-containing protein [Planctomycetota bacterium]
MSTKGWLAAVVVMGVAAVAYAAPIMLNGVPDWNQPLTYAAFVPPLDGPPGPGGGPAGVTNWCTPTAGANVMGWWEDTQGQNGIGDGVAFPGVIAYPNNDTDAGAADGLPDYLQNQWNDGIIEMGWHMDTQAWRTNIQHGGTLFGAGVMDCPGGITTYLNNYSNAQWTVWNYDVFNGGNSALAWNDYLTGGLMPTLPPIPAPPINGLQIGQPVMVTLDVWVDPNNQNMFDDGQIQWYDWSTSSSDAHTVTGVGYAINWDPDAGGPLLAGNWMIAHDGWGTTGVNVAVPWDDFFTNIWWANTHVDLVPEPASVGLLVLGAIGLIRRRRRC